MYNIFKLSLVVFLISAFSVNAETIKVKLVTTEGDIHIDLYEDKAPITVTNFLRYVDAGHFNGGAFYRVVRMDNQSQNNIKIEVIQGGMSGNSDIGLFEPIKLERTSDTGIKHLDGTISMARGGPDTASSEFFICVNPQPSLDFGGMRNADGQGFAAFGQVTMGMDVVRKIQNSKTDQPTGEQ
ncbi:MAG: peptidylprolyl isomerase, partial [Kordiimonadaceae bacterium]|nr:peptidylprolyl isomerase [Kordiimonadaceae bacterium]